MSVFIVVRCPKCGRLQLFTPTTKDYIKWKKKCVYCGYTFSVNPKSKHSSSIIMYVSYNIKDAQEYIKKHQNI